MNWGPIRQLHTGGQVTTHEQNRFCETFGFDSCSDMSFVLSIKKLLEGKHSYNSGIYGDYTKRNVDVSNSWMDHQELYRSKEHGTMMLVGQNYTGHDDLDPYMINDLEDNTHKLGVRAVVFSAKHSWYYPNTTTIVCLMSKETFEFYKNDFSKFGKPLKIV